MKKIKRERDVRRLLKSHSAVIDERFKQRMEDFEDIKRRLVPIYEEHIEKVLMNYVASTILVLRDELGYGAKRIENFLDKIMYKVDFLRDGTVSQDDVYEQIKLETGFDFKAKMERVIKENENRQGNSGKNQR